MFLSESLSRRSTNDMAVSLLTVEIVFSSYVARPFLYQACLQRLVDYHFCLAGAEVRTAVLRLSLGNARGRTKGDVSRYIVSLFQYNVRPFSSVILHDIVNYK